MSLQGDWKGMTSQIIAKVMVIPSVMRNIFSAKRINLRLFG